jgi:HSP20 family protein
MKTLSDTPALNVPRYSVTESPEAATVRIELPGVAKEAIQLSFKDRALHLRAQRTGMPENVKVVHRELPTADYGLTLKVANRLDGDNVQARHEDGVLTLTFPVAASAQPRTIAIN